MAAVRAFGRMVAWATEEGCREDVLPGLVPVMQAALAPDQERALHAVRPLPPVHLH